MENPLGRGIFQSALNVGERGSPEGARTDGGGSSARPAVPSPGKHWEVEPPRLALTRADEALPGADRLPDHRLHFHRALSFSRSSPRRLSIFPTLTRRRSERGGRFLTSLRRYLPSSAGTPGRWSAWGPQRGPCPRGRSTPSPLGLRRVGAPGGGAASCVRFVS